MLHRISRGARGFTLLELMVAVSILALAIMWLVEATTRAIEAENHAKLVTTASFLARRVLVELEDELADKGMQDDAFASEKEGTFEEDGFKRFIYRRITEKIVLPSTGDVQSAMTAAQNNAASLLGGASGPSGGLGGIPGLSGIPGMGTGPSSGGAGGAGSAGMFTSQFGMVKDILEQAIRRVTIKVVWREHGKEQIVEVQEYITDPRRVDNALGGMGALLGALGGAGGQNGGTNGTGTTTGSTTTPGTTTTPSSAGSSVTSPLFRSTPN